MGRVSDTGQMRYPDGGAVGPAGRAAREAVRLRAAEMFAAGVVDNGQVAVRLRVSRKSVIVWRQAWRSGGEAALVSKGASGAACRLDGRQIARLESELDKGPAVHGYADQRWTLARIAALIGTLFHQRYTLRGASLLMHRIGWSPQVPAHRAKQRDALKIVTWVKEEWPRGKAWP